MHVYTELVALAPPARHCMLVCVRSDLASEPGAANTCSDRACSPGSVARYCKLVHVKSDMAGEPGAACPFHTKLAALAP